jgi:hypothetical protein
MSERRACRLIAADRSSVPPTPRLAGWLGSSCTPEAARRWGSPLLFNESRGDGIPEAERR